MSLDLEDTPRACVSRIPDANRMVLAARDNKALEGMEVDRVYLRVVLLKDHLLPRRRKVENPRCTIIGARGELR